MLRYGHGAGGFSTVYIKGVGPRLQYNEKKKSPRLSDKTYKKIKEDESELYHLVKNFISLQRNFFNHKNKSVMWYKIIDAYNEIYKSQVALKKYLDMPLVAISKKLCHGIIKQCKFAVDVVREFLTKLAQSGSVPLSTEIFRTSKNIATLFDTITITKENDSSCFITQKLDFPLNNCSVLIQLFLGKKIGKKIKYKGERWYLSRILKLDKTFSVCKGHHWTSNTTKHKEQPPKSDSMIPTISENAGDSFLLET